MKTIFVTLLFSGLLLSCGQNTKNSTANEATEMQTASAVSTSNISPSPAQGDVWLASLITDTPQEGRELAIKMARKTIGAIQKDPEVKKRLRGVYSEDSELLIFTSQVVAIEFQTVAEANNFWRK